MSQLHQAQFYMVEVGSITQIMINSPGSSRGSPFQCQVPLPGQRRQPESHRALCKREMKHSECPFPAWLWLLIHSAAMIPQDSPREGNGLN